MFKVDGRRMHFLEQTGLGSGPLTLRRSRLDASRYGLLHLGLRVYHSSTTQEALIWHCNIFNKDLDWT